MPVILATEGRNQEDQGSDLAPGKQLRDPIVKK
jgi:hypothetical protein